jgi:glutamate synthase (NADPH/NADH) small chain
MATSVLRFTHVHRQAPRLRDPAERNIDFAEIYQGFDPVAAARQASRCSQCGVPFCQVNCPVGNHIPDWLALCAEGRLREAWELSQSTNSLPEICGRICPQDRLCEGACVLEQSGHETVTIGAIERYLSDLAFAEGWVQPIAPPRREVLGQESLEKGNSVGIVGSGPAGLAAAEQLRRLGYAVHIYERADRPGGLLTYGIPGFKLDKAVVQRRLDWLAQSGVEFHLGVDVGRSVSLTALRDRHQALLLATGVYRARPLTIEGAELPGVIAALDYLVAQNRADMGDDVPAHRDGRLHARGKRVVVIGGGDTAMDCVRTAIRQGATKVTCLYRRDRANMPGSQREVGHAEAEGVQFRWQSAPLAVLGQADAAGQMQLQAVRACRVELGDADASGRQQPLLRRDQAFEEPADLVISALGFEPEALVDKLGDPRLLVRPDGTLQSRDLHTSLPGVFAAGDIHRGASLVVWAIRDGRDAAQAIHRYVQSALPIWRHAGPAPQSSAASSPAANSEVRS